MDDAIDIEMQCDVLVILSIICQFDVHRKVWIEDIIDLWNLTVSDVSLGIKYDKCELCCHVTVLQIFCLDSLFLIFILFFQNQR